MEPDTVAIFRKILLEARDSELGRERVRPVVLDNGAHLLREILKGLIRALDNNRLTLPLSDQLLGSVTWGARLIQ